MKFENINMLNDTMAILDRGYYEVNGKRVNLKLSKAEMKEISVFLPKDVKSISDNKDFQHIHMMGGRIGVDCVNMDSYSLAIKRYSDCSYLFSKKSKPILVLNLANPVNPGGGVRRGSKAQEEDLCRKSSLLLSLESSAASVYYKYNKSLNTYMGSDAVMVTPQVEIIKDENGSLLDESVIVSVMTCAAPMLRNGMEGLTDQEYRDMVYGRITGKMCIRDRPGTVLTGSHLDTVKNGGKYDGALGVVTGVAALGYLKQSGFVPKHSLEVAGLMEEEGSRFPSGCQGSRAICGTLKEEDLEELSRDGVTLREALVSAGYQTEALKNMRRDDIRAIVELHIEQGPVLESEHKQIGIVDSIVGIVNYELTIQGSQNHAGTTSMPLRHDPVVALSLIHIFTVR